MKNVLLSWLLNGQLELNPAGYPLGQSVEYSQLTPIHKQALAFNSQLSTPLAERLIPPHTLSGLVHGLREFLWFWRQ